MGNKILKLIIVFCFYSGIVVAQESVNQFTLNSLLDSALQRNYLLQSNRLNTNVKQTEIDKLKINYLPVINTSASFSYWKFLLPNKERLLGSNRTDLYTDVSVYQTIYDFGSNNTEKELKEQEIILNEVIQQQIRQTIIYGVAEAYFSVLSSEEEIRARENAIEQLNSHLKYTEHLYNIGKVSSVDVLKINVELSVEEKNLKKAQNEYKAQKIKIQNLCYLENNDFTVKNFTDSLYNQSKSELYVRDVFYRKVHENHPLLLQSDVRSDLERKQQEMYKLQNRPELFAYGIGSWEHGYIPFGDNFNYNIGVGIKYTLPYFGGSGYEYEITKSDYLIEQLSVEKNQSFLEIKSEIDLALNELQSFKEDIDNQLQIINLATETIDNAKVKYKAGQGSIIDVLDAQSILTDANIAYDKSVISYLKTVAKLHYLTANDDYPF